MRKKSRYWTLRNLTAVTAIVLVAAMFWFTRSALPEIIYKSPLGPTIYAGQLLVSLKEPPQTMFKEQLAPDLSIREIGNIVFSPQFNKHFFYYSVFEGKYTQSNVQIFVRWSTDNGQSWSEPFLTMKHAGEDPYVVVSNNVFYMYYEDKETSPFRHVNLAESINGIEFALTVPQVVRPTDDPWQSSDASSPVVYFDGEKWVMLYEGRGKTTQGQSQPGLIGAATSLNLRQWTQPSEPIIINRPSESFAQVVAQNQAFVPDDIYIDPLGTRHILYHTFGKAGFWQMAMASETSEKWTNACGCLVHFSSTIMIFDDNQDLWFVYSKSNQVYRERIARPSSE